MTAAESGAAEPRERRKRTVALVALSACVALLAYAAARKAPTLRTAPEAVPSLPPGECSCNVRGCLLRRLRWHAPQRHARLATQAAGIAPNPPFVSDVRCPLRAGCAPSLKQPSVAFRRASRS
jgi:hypothetical protein